MASGSGGKPPEHGGGPAGKDCESCRSAPGIPFCRVEWSFLCAGCAAVVHANNWIIAVPPNHNPNPNPNPNPSPSPSPYPYSYPFPNTNPNPNHDPNLVVQLSSSDDARKGGRRGRRRSAGKAGVPPRAESVMRYREKRKSRQFEKTVRYETRKAYADQRPRVDGKFARPEGSGGEGTLVPTDEVGMPDAHFPAMVAASNEVGMPDAYFPVMPSAGEEAGPHAGEEVMLPAVEELGLMDAGEEVRLQ